MSSPERSPAAATQLAKEFLTTVGETVKERLRELEARKELPSDDATLWNSMLEHPTKRLQMTESLSWSYYEPLLRGILDKHAANFRAEDEETARAAQWTSHQRIGKIERLLATATYRLVLAELDEQIQLEREEAGLAMSGPWNLHAAQDAFDHEYDCDRFLLRDRTFRKEFGKGSTTSSSAVQDLNKSIENFVANLSPLELFQTVCEHQLRDKNSRAAYWTVYVMLGAFSQLRPAESRLPALAEELEKEFLRKPPSDLHGAYVVLIKLSEQMDISRGEWSSPVPASLSVRDPELPRRRSRSRSVSHSDSQVEPADHGQYEPAERRRLSGNPPAWDDWRWHAAWRSRNSYTPPQSPNGTLR